MDSVVPALSDVSPSDVSGTPAGPGPLPVSIEQVAAEANGDVDHWLRTARTLRSAGRAAEARALLDVADASFATSATLQHDRARLAEDERDWPSAERCWRTFATLNPSVAWGWLHAAQALYRQDRIADAEVVLAEARERFPNDAGVSIDHARAAVARRDWPEADQRWAAVTARFPNLPDGLVGQARTRRGQGRTDAARALLIEAAQRYPAASAPVHDLARLAEAQRDWVTAERWWRVWLTLEPGIW